VKDTDNTARKEAASVVVLFFAFVFSNKMYDRDMSFGSYVVTPL